MLGIGDIVMPGLLLCFVLRYDNYKKQASGDSCGAPGPANISGRMQKVSYFHCTLIGYFVGKKGQQESSWAITFLQHSPSVHVFQLPTRKAVTACCLDSQKES
jgi:hypothetical protein|uniref:Sppl3 protein n=1 Tax=Mus musculus TaxID=10090 RepID=Q66L48_MOUSE|nr:Sppl3 protein [Mus musculus]